ILNASDLKSGVLETTTNKILDHTEKFYLLSTSLDMKLCNVIDSLSKTLKDKAALTCVRFAYDINFELETEVRAGKSEDGFIVRSLAELLEQLEYDENLILKRDDYHIVINDDDVDEKIADSAVAKLFQQTVFLNLNVDIKKKSEIKKALIKERFRANYQKLREQINIQKNYLETALIHANLTEQGKERIAGMVAAFDKMIEETEKARKRPLRIAAMGTKKAGKSVVINSLLKRDYAPTSSELPTPNIIKYIPADADSELTLEYQDSTKIFDSAEELSNFIGNEFENAQQHTGEGSGLDDMIIHYPCDDLSGYEIWDTPGPNFAGAGDEHQKIAEQCIEAADVCIFVMNYSNHLTNDEVKFLNQIHEAFEKNDKFYSLFITVNRIDERYAAEVEKSVNRILDYIAGRLEELDYKNIVIFGTSALQSFYLEKVLGILKELDMEPDEDDEFSDVVRRLKKKHREFMVPVRFIEDALKNLEDFHDIEEPDAATLENFSGIPQLWRHVKYIGEQKVDTEIVDSVIGRCETQFATIRNALLVTGLQKLSADDKARLEDLESKIINLTNTVSRAMSDIDKITGNSDSLKLAKYGMAEEADSIKREAIRVARDRSKAIVQNSAISDYDVEQLQSGRRTENIKKLMDSLNNLITGANNTSAQRLVKLIQVEGNNFSRKVESAVQEAQEKIIAETERVKESIGGDNVAADMIRAFTLPQFPVSLNKLSSSVNLESSVTSAEMSVIAKNSTKIIQESRSKTERRKRGARGFWEHLAFWKDYYEDVTVWFDVDVVKADSQNFKANIQRFIQNQIVEAIESAHDEMKSDVAKKITDIYDDVQNQCQEIAGNYNDIFSKFKDDIDAAKDETSAHKKAIEHDIGVLVDIESKITPFFELWEEILYGDDAR
ncbi:MAG: dynamin family protein, partial [Selenomonadaceae bacterium]|nr:dynamin family protein [Selenomonadaceae bacterium]